MSWWTKVRDTWEKVNTLGFYDPEKSRHEEADQRYQVNDQIKAYKDLTNLSREELSRKRDELVAEKRKISEKQIRRLRSNYRPAGLLNSVSSGIGSGPENVEGGLVRNLGG